LGELMSDGSSFGRESMYEMKMNRIYEDARGYKGRARISAACGYSTALGHFSIELVHCTHARNHIAVSWSAR
jgi:hypothetical protein